MLIDIRSARVTLQRGQTSRLHGAGPSFLSSACGTLWVTLDNDRRDIVLKPGEGFGISNAVGVLVCALGGPATLELRPAMAEPVSGVM